MVLDKCRRCGEEFDGENFVGKVQHTKEHYGKETSLVYYQGLFERVKPMQTRLGE